MTPKRRTAIVVAAPLVAVATLMVGLRVGAGNGFHAALVHISRPGREAQSGGARPYSFQITTYFEDRGVREAVAMKNLVVDARNVDGEKSLWKGESNTDGIAEVNLSFSGMVQNIAFDLREEGESEPLAFGIVNMLSVPARPRRMPIWDERDAARVRPSKREGELLMDVYLDGGRLVVGSQSSVWVFVHPKVPQGKNADETWQSEASYLNNPAFKPTLVKATPELGVTFLADEAKADCGGYAQLPATALGQAASTLLEATGPKGEKGVWFGTLPTAPGAFSIHAPAVYFSDETKPEEREAIVVAPNPRTIAYVEIDDDQGREWAAALPLATEGGDPLPRAHVPLGQLHDGFHWLVASGDPRGAEKMSGATMAKAITISKRSACTDCDKTCDLKLLDAQVLPPGFPRMLAIDGIATRGARNRARHRLGLFIGLLALGVASLLEVLLLTQASREARMALAAAEVDSPIAPMEVKKTPGGNLLVALLIALLGFAFLAALLIAKA